ncbi:hypothetical protein GY45DRAFT_1119294 [Cubamyces sp. BRFM 1775]|nr:hypothetical protein GY45DRAFT_1119294 [Cubamyces sp. BRFM 1775]
MAVRCSLMFVLPLVGKVDSTGRRSARAARVGWLCQLLTHPGENRSTLRKLRRGAPVAQGLTDPENDIHVWYWFVHAPWFHLVVSRASAVVCAALKVSPVRSHLSVLVKVFSITTLAGRSHERTRSQGQQTLLSRSVGGSNRH